ncbi:MAG: GGDEF domain-containing protein [Candidatus Sulfotelmatobacter sp.]
MQERIEQINRRLQEISGGPQSSQLAEEFVNLFQEKRRLEQPPGPSSRRSPGAMLLDLSRRDYARAETHSGSILANINSQLSKLEKRDWELWWIVSITGLVVGGALVLMLLPAAFADGGNLHFEITVSRQLVIGLIVLLILLNTYLVSRRIELRRLRERMISSTIQNELVRLQSFTDPLTEIYNRRSLEELANRYISHARRQKKPLTFMLIDVDRFKDVNTRFGHLTGDFVLAEIASLLRTAIRGSDAVIRYGGDEFVIVTDASVTDAQKVIQRIESYLNDWNRSAHLENCTISLSIGLAEWVDGLTIEQVLDRADQDMYARKRDGAADTSASPKSKAKSAAASKT